MNSSDILVSVIFYTCAFLILGCAICSILAKKIIHSIFLAVIVFFATAGLFFLLNAQYNAVVQIAIYGLAVPILFVLAIMFTSQQKEDLLNLSFSPKFLIALISAVLLFLTIFNILIISSSVIEWLFTPQSALNINQFEMFDAISTGLYTTFFFAFELVSLLIFMVILGLSTLNLYKEKKRG